MELTVQKLVKAISNIEDNQVLINMACAQAFSGRNTKAPKDSCLHRALVALIKIRDEFNTANKASNDVLREQAKASGLKATGIKKYNGLNILATEVTRWIHKVNRTPKYNGLRASIKATGGSAKYSIALVQSMKAQANTSADPKLAKETGDKSLNDLDCNTALKYLVDSFSYDVVALALAKLK